MSEEKHLVEVSFDTRITMLGWATTVTSSDKRINGRMCLCATRPSSLKRAKDACNAVLGARAWKAVKA
jgi:hypothetical protein